MSRGRFRTGIIAAATAALALGAAQAASALTPTVTEHVVPSASSAPWGLAAGLDGALWFAESGANRIARMDTSGATTEYSLPNPSSDPRGVAVGPDGNLWFVEGAGNRIGKISPSGVVAEYPIPTPNSGALGITRGADGNLWFTETSAGKVGSVTPAGMITEYSLPTTSSQPEGIVSGPGGALWVTEHAANQIARVTSAGAATEFSIPTANSGATRIAVGADGNLWFTENIAGQVGRLTPAGAITEFPLPSPGHAPTGIAAGPDGALWFTEDGANAIGRIDTSGSVAEFTLPTAAASPKDIVAGPDGNLWFTEFAANQIGRVTTPPAATTNNASAVAPNGATVTGTANAHAQATTLHFEYGATAAYGAVTGPYDLAPTATDQVFNARLSALAPSSTYHYRLVAQNATGTTYGPDQTFVTLPASLGPPAGGQVPPGGLPGLRLVGPPAVSISSAPVRVTRAGVATILITCPKSAVTGCRGTVTLTLAHVPADTSRSRRRAVIARCGRGCRPLGQATLTASPGQSKRVPVKLNHYAQTLLAHHLLLSVRVTVTTRANGRVFTESQLVVLRAPTAASGKTSGRARRQR